MHWIQIQFFDLSINPFRYSINVPKNTKFEFEIHKFDKFFRSNNSLTLRPALRHNAKGIFGRLVYNHFSIQRIQDVAIYFRYTNNFFTQLMKRKPQKQLFFLVSKTYLCMHFLLQLHALLRKKRFELNFLFQQNGSEFAIFTEKENPHSFVSFSFRATLSFT